jgi:hypothetical protein
VLAKQHDWKPAWPHSDEVLIRIRLNENDIAARLGHLAPDTVDTVVLKDLVNDVTGVGVLCAPGERHVVAWWDWRMSDIWAGACPIRDRSATT